MGLIDAFFAKSTARRLAWLVALLLASAGQAAPSQPLALQPGESVTRLAGDRLLLSGAVTASGEPSGELYLVEETTGVRKALPVKLSTPRTDHTATVLADGRVAFIGGIGPKRALAQTVEVVDLDSMTSAVLPLRMEPRRAHSATLKLDGRVVLLGGAGAALPNVAAALVDVDEGSVRTGMAPEPVRLKNHRATTLPSGDIVLSAGEPTSATADAPPAYLVSPALAISPLSAQQAAARLAIAQPGTTVGVVEVLGEPRRSARGESLVIAARFDGPALPTTASRVFLDPSAGASATFRIVSAEGGRLLFVWSPTRDALAGTLVLNGFLNAAGAVLPDIRIELPRAGAASAEVPASSAPQLASKPTVSQPPRPLPPQSPATEPGTTTRVTELLDLSAKLSKLTLLPLAFEMNEGQFSGGVRAGVRGVTYELQFADNDFVLRLPSPSPAAREAGKRFKALADQHRLAVSRATQAGGANASALPDGLARPSKAKSAVAQEAARLGVEVARAEEEFVRRALRPTIHEVRISPVGGSPKPQLVPEERSRTVTNILAQGGRVRHAGIPNYGRLRYRDVYPGIDKVVYGRQGEVEFDWVVAPGVDPRTIVQRVSGTLGLTVESNGDMKIRTAGEAVTLRKPSAYQVIGNERRAVAVAYQLRSSSEFGFVLGDYDPSRELVIDPVVEYATFVTPSRPAVGLYANPASEMVGIDYSSYRMLRMASASDGSLFMLVQLLDPIPYQNLIGTDVSNASGSALIKLNPSGTEIEYVTYLPQFWAARIAVDGQDRPIIAANDRLFRVSGEPPGTAVSFVARFNTAGDDFEWYRQMPHVDLGNTTDLKIGPDGDLYVLGIRDLDYGPQTGIIHRPIPEPFSRLDGVTGLEYACVLQRLSSDASVVKYTAALPSCMAPSVLVHSDSRVSVVYEPRTNTTSDAPAPPDYLASPLPANFFPQRAGLGRWVHVGADGATTINRGWVTTPEPAPGWLYSYIPRGAALDSSGNVFIGGAFLTKIDPRTGQHLLSKRLAQPFNPSQEFPERYAVGNFASFSATLAGWDYNWESAGLAAGGGRIREAVVVTPDSTVHAVWNSRLDACCNPESGQGRIAGYRVANGSYVYEQTFSANTQAGLNSSISLLDLVPGPGASLFVLGYVPISTSLINPEYAATGTGPEGGGLFVAKIGTDWTLTTVPGPSEVGQPVRIVVDTSGFQIGTVLTGTMTFRSGSRILGSVTGSSFTYAQRPAYGFELTVSDLPLGVNPITAEYSGDPNFPARTLQTTHEVRADFKRTVTLLFADKAVFSEGEDVVLYAQVRTAEPEPREVTSGTIRIRDNYLPLVDVPISPTGLTVVNLGRRCRISGSDFVNQRLPTRFLGEFLGTPQLARSVSVGTDIRIDPPITQVKFAQPADGAVIPPSSVPVVLDVADTGCAQIVGAKIFLNGALLRDFATGPPYQVDLPAFIEGRYTLTATVTLIDRTVTRNLSAAPVTFLVSNSGPLTDVEVTFLHNDAAGSPVAATSAAGAVKWSRGYQPYGEFSSQTGAATDTRQFFHGKPLDGESGLQYFGARYYDPLLGRFMAMDPAPWNETNLHSFNRYAFANNNPTRFTDPDGRQAVPLTPGGVPGFAVAPPLQSLPGRHACGDCARLYELPGYQQAPTSVGLQLPGFRALPPQGMILLGFAALTQRAEDFITEARSFIVYGIRNAAGQIVYVGRASGEGDAEAVLGKRESSHQHKGQGRFGILDTQDSREANRGGEEVIYQRERLKAEGEGRKLLNIIQPVSGRNKEKAQRYVEQWMKGE